MLRNLYRSPFLLQTLAWFFDGRKVKDASSVNPPVSTARCLLLLRSDSICPSFALLYNMALQQLHSFVFHFLGSYLRIVRSDRLLTSTVRKCIAIVYSGSLLFALV